jgi:hypothetical protein
VRNNAEALLAGVFEALRRDFLDCKRTKSGTAEAMSITEYAIQTEPQTITAKSRTSGPMSLSMALFVASVATTVLAKVLGN